MSTHCMCSDPLDPGGEVCGCSVGCTLGMSDISPLRVYAAWNVHREFPELKKWIFKRVCFGCGGGRRSFAVMGRQKSLFSGPLIGPKPLFCFALIACNFEIYAARCCIKQQKTAARAAVVHESSDTTVPSRKARCRALPDNPETGDTYHKQRKKLRWRENTMQSAAATLYQRCHYV